MMDLRSIARALGGQVVAGKVVQVLAPGPGHSAADRSLAIRLSPTSPFGFITHSHAGDDWRTCRDYVLDRLGMPRSPQNDASTHHSHLRAASVKADARPDNRQRAGEIWRAAGNPRGTIVEQYLASRSLELADNIACSVIRFHAACPWRDETGKPARVPAMISLFRTINSDEPVAIQRTALTAAGKKLGRLSLGPVGHAAIKIDPDENVTAGLHIGEGFETCLAARMLGLRPVWALGSASAIAAFPLLSGIDCLSVLAETDDHGANAAAIEKAGTRWVAAGREVTILEPKIGGDANDALRSIMQ